MATYSTGITATWGSTSFAEVFSLSVASGNGRQGRSAVWSADGTTISLQCYGAANISAAEIGERKNLVVGGGGVSFSGYAVCTNVSASPQLNGVTQYAASYKSIE